MGDVLGSVEARDLRLSETLHGSATHAAPHRHRRPYFCYVIHGEFTEDSDRGSSERGFGSLVYHPGSAGHADRFGTAGARCLNLELGESWHAEASGVSSQSVLLTEHRARWAARRLFETWRRRDTAYCPTLQGIVSLLLAEVLQTRRPFRRNPSWLTVATGILDREYRQPWSRQALAARVGVSVSTLSRGFRRRHGCTVGNYVHHHRVEEAIRSLVAGTTPLSALAARLGFADQSHFTRIFRRHTGLTPVGYAATVLAPSTLRFHVTRSF